MSWISGQWADILGPYMTGQLHFSHLNIFVKSITEKKNKKTFSLTSDNTEQEKGERIKMEASSTTKRNLKRISRLCYTLRCYVGVSVSLYLPSTVETSAAVALKEKKIHCALCQGLDDVKHWDWDALFPVLSIFKMHNLSCRTHLKTNELRRRETEKLHNTGWSVNNVTVKPTDFSSHMNSGWIHL